MQIMDVLKQAQGGNAIENMARSFNITPAQAEAAIKAVVPELSRGIERNTLSRGGLADLIAALGDQRHQAALQDPNLFKRPEAKSAGNAILGHILGGRDQSRAVAARAVGGSGLSEGLIQMLLPYIAQMLMGALSGKTQGGLGDILSKIPGGAGGQGGGLGDILSKIPGMPGGPQPRATQVQLPQAETVPAPQSGSIFGGGNPLPMPGEATRGGYSAPQPAPANNPYGELSDILRGGKGAPAGAGAGAAIGGGMLWNLVRSMLGGALGFNGKSGVMGWLFRTIVMRYGWGLLKTIIMKVLLRR
jgi:hypothetical protein